LKSIKLNAKNDDEKIDLNEKDKPKQDQTQTGQTFPPNNQFQQIKILKRPPSDKKLTDLDSSNQKKFLGIYSLLFRHIQIIKITFLFEVNQ
jgi:hypothetical protein